MLRAGREYPVSCIVKLACRLDEHGNAEQVIPNGDTTRPDMVPYPHHAVQWARFTSPTEVEFQLVSDERNDRHLDGPKHMTVGFQH
jgi:hypothetical protein